MDMEGCWGRLGCPPLLVRDGFCLGVGVDEMRPSFPTRERLC